MSPRWLSLSNAPLAVTSTILALACAPPRIPDAATDATPRGDAPRDAPFSAGSPGCAGLVLEAGADLSGYRVDRFTWSDQACARRSAAMVRNDGPDPGGSNGGYLRELTWRGASQDVVARGSGSSGYNGWGYVTNHFAGTADLSMRRTGTYRTLFVGAHHAVHEYRLQMRPGGPVDVTIRWTFATGRSHPVYAITFDASPAGPDALKADTRAPYGDLLFEGSKTDIGGIAWGDQYRFTTTGEGPLSPSSPWDYSQPNKVPFVRMWSKGADAEMGAVQTESFADRPAGGDYGAGLLQSACWGKTSTTKGPGCTSGWALPTDWLWPFQLNQYQLASSSSAHRLAWGSTYGAVGQTSYQSFGRTLSGYPYLSYAVFMVIGQRTAEAVMTQVAEVERALGARVTASRGTVVTEGPGGVGRGDLVPYRSGHNPSYATFDLEAVEGGATLVLSPDAGPLRAPTLRLLAFSRPQVTRVAADGVVLAPNEHYFASVDPTERTLWLTLHGTVNAPLTLEID